MKKRKILPWIIVGALGIGAYFGLKQCSDDTPKEKPKIVKKVKRPRRQSQGYSREFIDFIRQSSTRQETPLYYRALNMCFDVNEWNTARIMALDGDYEGAIDMLYDKFHHVVSPYRQAFKYALKAGDIDKARELLFKQAARNKGWLVDTEIPKFFLEIGDYDNAMKLYKEYGAKKLAIKAALDNDDVDTAKTIFDDLRQHEIFKDLNKRHDSQIYYDQWDLLTYSPSDLKDLGYYEDFRQQCDDLGDWVKENFEELNELVENYRKVKFVQIELLSEYHVKFSKEERSKIEDIRRYERCWANILREEGRYEDLVEFELNRHFGSPLNAELQAQEHDIDTEDLESDIEGEIRKMMDDSTYLYKEDINKIVKAGYGDHFVRMCRENGDKAHLYNILYNILRAEQKMGNVDAVLDTYEDIIKAGKSADAYIDAAKYARKQSKPDEEAYFLRRLLNEKDSIRAKNDKDTMIGATVYAMVRLGREDEAMKFCESLPNGKCYCAHEVMKAVYKK